MGLSFTTLIVGRGGGIGRRAGFKIQYPRGCEGSSPSLGTMLIIKGLDRLYDVDLNPLFIFIFSLGVHMVTMIVTQLLNRCLFVVG